MAANHGPLWRQLLYDASEKILPRRLYLIDVELFLTLDDSSAPADQHPLSQQKFHINGSGFLLIATNFSAPADENPQILIQNIK